MAKAFSIKSFNSLHMECVKVLIRQCRQNNKNKSKSVTINAPVVNIF